MSVPCLGLLQEFFFTRTSSPGCIGIFQTKNLYLWALLRYYSYQISTNPATAGTVCHQGWSCVIIFTGEKVELSSVSRCLHLVSCYKRQFWTSPLLNKELETKVSENTCLLLRHEISSFLFILKLFTLPTWWEKKKKKAQQAKLESQILITGTQFSGSSEMHAILSDRK